MAGSLFDFACSGDPSWQPTNGSRTTLQVDERNATLIDPERELYDLWNP
jgi:hypothetical protein